MREVNLKNLKKPKRRIKASTKFRILIEDYRVMATTIEVDFTASEAQQNNETVYLPKEKYEQWLADTEKLHFEIDEDEEHRIFHQEGEMQVEFYWDHIDYADKVKHLTAYLEELSKNNIDHALQLISGGLN